MIYAACGISADCTRIQRHKSRSTSGDVTSCDPGPLPPVVTALPGVVRMRGGRGVVPLDTPDPVPPRRVQRWVTGRTGPPPQGRRHSGRRQAAARSADRARRTCMEDVTWRTTPAPFST
ncbi:hypothetical protein DVK44_06840 [Streptomyces paludis]|uniref:Uncharacterized protein n=1 Tax=Streptomyces paludis TaxID=2282738 RepID=A0A345HL83_9ACTN|nr:hypothetical protein DVK44_06840 [Streptomyces paludis]